MGGFKIENHVELTQVESRQDTALGIMRWGRSNSFPQTLQNLINQSPVAKPAVARTAKFLKGGTFEGENTIVGPYGLTLKDVVGMVANDYAIYEAFVLHSNFNLYGKTTSIRPMKIAEMRFNELDELNFASKVGYHANYGRNAVEKKNIENTVTKGKIKWFDRFNPPAVLEQIAKTKDGIGNYLGQILYHTESGYSSYPIPPLQASINFVLSDVENSILIRKQSSTGFVQAYLLKTTLDSEDSKLIALEDAIEESQGARGTGKIITMSGLSPDDVSNTLLEELGAGASNSIIESASKAFELAKGVINGAYLIPPVLAGADISTGFNTQALKDAYFIFNAITQHGRDMIEQKINVILANGDFDVKSIKLQKLSLEDETTEQVTTEITKEGEDGGEIKKTIENVEEKEAANV